MKRYFTPEKDHAKINEMLSYCVNKDLECCRPSIDKVFVLIKTKENLQELPSCFNGVTEHENLDFCKIDINWKIEETED